jgi:hypothetical protein
MCVDKILRGVEFGYVSHGDERIRMLPKPQRYDILYICPEGEYIYIYIITFCASIYIDIYRPVT